MPSPLVAAMAALVATSSQATRTSSRSGVAAYEEFARQFGTERQHADAASYHARVALFEQRREEVQRHNARPGITWLAGVNKFSDYTQAEFQALLGHRSMRRAATAPAPATSFLQSMPSREKLAQAVDWSQTLNTSRSPKDQGSCGSCWAVASAGALETHAEIAAKGPVPEISYEQLVDCVPNPEECGGAGGCKGATSELALQYTHEHGLVAKGDYKGGYESKGDGKCKAGAATPILTTTGFVRLDVNKYQVLLEAVATQGPVVVSADASGWSSYKSGVFNECERDAVINHAILAMGYGTDAKLNEGERDYWLIRNSWGNSWGEKGFIRLLRHTAEDSFCGTDHEPLQGVGCKGGSASLPVCGMCGVLSDSAYPKGVSLVKKG